MSNLQTPKLLVTGASGKFGQLVIEHLLNLGVAPTQIIATTRKPESLADLASKGIEVRAADFDDPSSLQSAFAGAEVLLLVSTDSLGQGQRLIQHQNAINAAAKSGVKQLFYTSLPAADTSLIKFASDHLGTEEAIKASGVDYTILRNNWYAENLFMSLPGVLASGSWYSAAGEGGVAYITRSDLALAAAAALVKGPEVANQTFTLTGPEALSTKAIAAAVSEATGKPIQVVQVPLQAIIEGMVSHGFPEPIADIFASVDTAIAEGDLAEVTQDFQKLTGRKPETFASWLERNKTALVGQ